MDMTAKKSPGKPVRITEAPRPLVFKGRGTASNSVGRFEQLNRVEDDDGWGNLDEGFDGEPGAFGGSRGSPA